MMKSKTSFKIHQEYIAYENFKHALYKEILRLERLRRLHDREFFPKELKQIQELMEATLWAEQKQTSLAQRIAKHHSTQNPAFSWIRTVVVLLIIILVTFPTYFYAPKLPKPKFVYTLQDNNIPSPSNILTSLPPPRVSDKEDKAREKLAPATLEIAEHLLASSFRSKPDSLIEIEESSQYLKIKNLSNQTLRFELFDAMKRNVKNHILEDSCMLDKNLLDSQMTYYYHITRENYQLVYWNKVTAK